MSDVFFWIAGFFVGMAVVGFLSKWISYNAATGFYEGKKKFFNRLQEKKDEKK